MTTRTRRVSIEVEWDETGLGEAVLQFSIPGLRLTNGNHQLLRMNGAWHELYDHADLGPRGEWLKRELVAQPLISTLWLKPHCLRVGVATWRHPGDQVAAAQDVRELVQKLLTRLVENDGLLLLAFSELQATLFMRRR